MAYVAGLVKWISAQMNFIFKPPFSSKVFQVNITVDFSIFGELIKF